MCSDCRSESAKGRAQHSPLACECGNVKPDYPAASCGGTRKIDQVAGRYLIAMSCKRLQHGSERLNRRRFVDSQLLTERHVLQDEGLIASGEQVNQTKPTSAGKQTYRLLWLLKKSKCSGNLVLANDRLPLMSSFPGSKRLRETRRTWDIPSLLQDVCNLLQRQSSWSTIGGSIKREDFT